MILESSEGGQDPGDAFLARSSGLHPLGRMSTSAAALWLGAAVPWALLLAWLALSWSSRPSSCSEAGELRTVVLLALFGPWASDCVAVVFRASAGSSGAGSEPAAGLGLGALLTFLSPGLRRRAPLLAAGLLSSFPPRAPGPVPAPAAGRRVGSSVRRGVCWCGALPSLVSLGTHLIALSAPAPRTSLARPEDWPAGGSCPA
jgi:hypothetical protein